MDDDKVEKTGKIFQDYADAVGREIIQSMRDIVPKISKETFHPLKKFNENIDWSLISTQCENKIRNKIGKELTKSWADQNMNMKIAVLELMKKRSKNKAIKQWRPFNQTPLEQCQPYINEILKGKIYFLNTYLTEQRTKLTDELIPVVEMHRSNIQEIAQKQHDILAKIEGMRDTNAVMEERLKEMTTRLVYLKCLNRGIECNNRL